MDFIRKLPSRKTRKGNYVSWAVFRCGRCGNEVERSLSNGKRAATCGCTTDKGKRNIMRGLTRRGRMVALYLLKTLVGVRWSAAAHYASHPIPAKAAVAA
jgi:hypothetical protein